LALLQLIAPLVHAHAGEKHRAFPEIGSGKVHIPGLERYSIGNHPVTIGSLSHHYLAEGFVIGVDTGIKQKQAKPVVDSGTVSYFLPPPALDGAYDPPAVDINFPPHAPAGIFRLLVALHTPRAPPTQ